MAKATPADSSKPKKTGAGSKSAKTAATKKPNVFARLGTYLRDVRSEMKRVVWPGREEVVNSSIVVVVTLIFFVFFTLIVDAVVVQALDLLQGLS